MNPIVGGMAGDLLQKFHEAIDAIIGGFEDSINKLSR